MRGQEQLRGMNQLATLARIDRHQSAAKSRHAAIADLDEHEAAFATAVVQHDQVDLAAAKARIARDVSESCRQEVAARGCFDQCSAFAPIQRTGDAQSIGRRLTA